jgi:hypothetical protein
MPTSELRFRRRIRYVALVLAVTCGLSACEDNQTPAPMPGGLEIVSGDTQYTRKGTKLEDPVIVRVASDQGGAAPGMTVRFQVIEGGGTLSRTAVTTDNNGRASVRWTVGPNTGSNQLRVTVAENSALTAVATATSSEYYCVEEDPTFSAKFAGPHSLMMLTRSSSINAATSGLVRYDVNNSNHSFNGTSIGNYPDGAFLNVLRDCVFSANGDLFISWNHLYDEIVKVSTDGSVSHFAALDPAPIDASPGAELAMTPNGVLVGCDAVGPFYVTCRDTLFRFEDAIFSGSDLNRDAANNDALACDPNSGDVYFIYKQDRFLYRLPFDGTTAGAKEQVVQLPIDESDFARGMVVDGTDGSIYILVDAAATKSIVKVTSAGVRTTERDFFTRGAGDAAGVQSDLAIDRQSRYLYTLDTRNNVFLQYSLNDQQMFTLTPPGADPLQASNLSSGERVGLDVIPAGP